MTLEEAFAKAEKVFLHLWNEVGYMRFEVNSEDAKYNFANREDDCNHCDLEPKVIRMPHRFHFVFSEKKNHLLLYTHSPNPK